MQTLLGSLGMQAHRYPRMLNLIAAGTLEPERLVGKTLSLAGAALENMGRFSQSGVSVTGAF